LHSYHETIVKIILDKISIFRYNTRMKKYINKPWTDLERKTLSNHYNFESMETLLQLLPNRTETAIRNQVFNLKKKGYRIKT
jgi:hypothetical protein